jgi:hypothetical protein
MSAQLMLLLSRRKVTGVPWCAPAAGTTSSPSRNASAALDDPSALTDSGSSARVAAKTFRMTLPLLIGTIGYEEPLLGADMVLHARTTPSWSIVELISYLPICTLTCPE